MKKPMQILICTTCAFLLILVGIFIGRNATRGIISFESVNGNNKATLSQTNNSVNQPEQNNESGMININEATAEQLQLLPGIGETLSNRIIAYREDNGNFQSIEDLMNVNGIGEAKFEQIQNYITTGGQP